MQINLLSYSDSFLNPMLKLIVVLIFIIGTFYCYQARQKYGGELKKIATLLLVCGVAAICSATLRFLGDILILWKWGESLFFLGFGLITVGVAYLVLQLFRQIDFSD